MRRTAALSAVPLAVLLAGGLVWQGSQAAFTATTSNEKNAWNVGGMSLYDDDLNEVAFEVYNIVPGQAGEKCIALTSYANHPSKVRPYLQNLTTTNDVAKYLLLDIEQGTGGSFNSCAGFEPDAVVNTGPGAVGRKSLSELAGSHNSFSTGDSAWQTTGDIGETGEKKTYRVTWVFDTAGLNQSEVNLLQGGRIMADLVWEMQSDVPTP